MDQDEQGVLLPIPLPSDRIFRNQAMDDILAFLYRHPHDSFGVRELRNVTGHGAQTVDTALELFTRLDLITTERSGNQKLISINPDRIHKPDDPLLAIPQEAFRPPIKTFLDTLQSTIENLIGVIVFGSVARGDADRTSDIDLFIVVANDLTATRRTIHDIRDTISKQTFDGDRYEFHLMIESLDSADQYGEKLQTIFAEGIPLYQTDQLHTLRDGVLHGE